MGHDASAPSWHLELLGASVEGIDAGDDGGLGEDHQSNATIPRAGPIRIRVDRRVSPGSVSRNTVRLSSGTVNEFVFPSFDPVRSELLIELSRPLAVGAFYVLRLSDLIDLDGSALTSPVQFLFKVVAVDLPAEPEPVKRPSEIVALLAVRCAAGGCHSDSVHAAGLILSTADAIARTALAAPSQQSGSLELAGASGLTGLPIVDADRSPASPSRSYLIYKLLGDSHILGEAMPPPSNDEPLSSAEIMDISRWIAAGSPLE